MKKFVSIIVVAVTLSACANTQQIVSDAASKCPQIGVDVMAPDFYQKHKPQEVEEFYNCMLAALKTDDPNFAEKYVSIMHPQYDGIMNGTSNTKRFMSSAVAYQHILWRQVLDKEKTKGAAQEAWVLWVQNAQQTQAIKDAAASQAAATSAAAAQQSQQMQDMQNQQNWQNMQQQQQQFMQQQPLR